MINDPLGFTADEIAEAADTWVNFNGFTGATCGKCKKTANVLAGGLGWSCVCGHHNYGSIGMAIETPHESPDLGPSADVIHQGFDASEKYKKLMAIIGSK